MPVEDHYAALGVLKDASQEEIKRAFRRLTLELHPDRWAGDTEVATRFQAVTQAYNTLGDPARRLTYDQSLERSIMGFDVTSGEVPEVSISRVMNTLVGDLFGARRTVRRTGSDLRYTLTVDLEEACRGCSKRIEFEARGRCETCHGGGGVVGGEPAQRCGLCQGRGEVKSGGLLSQRSTCGRCQGLGMLHATPCSDCRGRGHRRQLRAFDITLPPSSRGGAERVLKGEGEPGRFGGKPGDLRVTVSVRRHPWLTRDAANLCCTVPISIVQASLGGDVVVPTLDGVATVRIPAGTRQGDRLRLRGKGVPSVQGSAGHLFLTVEIETPNADEPEVEAALRNLEAVTRNGSDVYPQAGSLRDYVAGRSGSDDREESR